MFKKIILTTLLSSFLFGDYTVDKLRYVIDGDTAAFNTMTCRFAYVDTPESGDNRKAKRDSRRYRVPLERIYKAGRYAKKYTKSRLRKGNNYRIGIIGTDRYGRKICRIFLPSGKTINEKLIEDGFAIPFWKYIPYNKRRKFSLLSLTAKVKNKGLWRLDPVLMDKMTKGK